ncbi:hypothetical protein BHM03_00026229, partial [Ensete ventricosum]
LSRQGALSTLAWVKSKGTDRASGALSIISFIISSKDPKISHKYLSTKGHMSNKLAYIKSTCGTTKYTCAKYETIQSKHKLLHNIFG